jgi:formate hydrogenlyase subunit 4
MAVVEGTVRTTGLLNILLALVLAPLMIGVINRVKAVFGGRRGQPLLQLYRDLFRLLRKGAVYSRTTTWVFRAGPMVGLAATIAALALLPCGSLPAFVAFPGDFILFAYLLGLARFMTVTAALDTGSAFEGMGASREVFFAMLAEPALLLGIAALAKLTGSLSLTTVFDGVGVAAWAAETPAMMLVAVAFFVVLLAENARIPVDDPNTHLELTMIHEVMVLDHSGPDFAFIQYGAALKLWAFGLVLTGMLPLDTGWPFLDGFISVLALFAVAAAVGVVESTMARLRLVRVPQLLLGAGAFALLALALVFR